MSLLRTGSLALFALLIMTATHASAQQAGFSIITPASEARVVQAQYADEYDVDDNDVDEDDGDITDVPGAVVGGAADVAGDAVEGAGDIAEGVVGGAGDALGLNNERAVEACAARFRSFDPSTGMYTTYSGEQVMCPYLRG